MGGMGLDAAMIANTSGDLKKKVGWVAYVDGAAKSLVKAKPFPIMYQVLGHRMHRAHIQSVLFANCGSLPAGLELIPEASVADGDLDIVIFQPKNPIGWLAVWRRVAWDNSVLRVPRRSPHPAAAHEGQLRALRRAPARARRGSRQPIQLDGDEFGEATAVSACGCRGAAPRRARRAHRAASSPPRRKGARIPTGTMDAMSSPSIVWFRDDLRLADNPALRARRIAASPSSRVPARRGLARHASARRRRSVVAASQPQRARRAPPREGIRAVLRRGAAADVLPTLVGGGRGRRVLEPALQAPSARSTRASRRRCAGGVEVSSFAASCCSSRGPSAPAPAPLRGLHAVLEGVPQLRAARAAARAARAARAGTAPGIRRPRRLGPAADETGLGGGPARTLAARRGRRAAPPARVPREDADDYDRARDEPAGGATSMLSPRLRWGELSPTRCGTRRWRRERASEASSPSSAGASSRGTPSSTAPTSRRRTSGRPSTPSPGRGCARSCCARGSAARRASPRGCRDARALGVGLHAQPGADGDGILPHQEPAHRLAPRRGVVLGHLVDADAASNPFNWQWVAGSGADAAPYFRIFNPELQAKKFDPTDGTSASGRRMPRTGSPRRSEGIARRNAEGALAAYEAVKNAR
jgi:hypothetical protein